MRGDNEIQQLIDHRTGPCVDIPNGEYVGDVTIPAGVTLSCEYGTRIRGDRDAQRGGDVRAPEPGNVRHRGTAPHQNVLTPRDGKEDPAGGTRHGV
jgi:hypothetical protein